MTASLRDTLEQLAATFAAEVLSAIRASSLDEILAQTEAPMRGRAGRPKRGLGSAAVADARVRSPGNATGKRLARRSAGALDDAVDQIVTLLSRSPKGLRAEQIRARLGLSAKELPRPIAKALGAARIRKVGQKRATTYFATS